MNKTIEKKYWEMVYNIVDPFRKDGDKPIDELVVYMDRDSFQTVLDFMDSEVQKEREEAVRLFIHWINGTENHQRDIDIKFWLGEAEKYKELSQTKGDE